MNKKADANMWWIIIGAVIALVVMIVLMVMFTGKSNKLEIGLSSCESKGGVCVFSSDSCPSGSLITTAFDCGNNNNCCLGSPKRCDDTCKNTNGCILDVKRVEWCR